MKLADVVTADRVVVPLQSDSLTAAAWILLERLVAAGAVTNVEKLRARVAEERVEDIVAMGDRAFLLHYRTDAVSALHVALGVAAKPVCRDLSDDETQCARVLLLVVAPPRMATRYLQVVGAFARLLSKADVVDAIHAQPNAAALASLPHFAEVELPEQITVRDIMTENPRNCTGDLPLREAALDMVRFGVGGLPVVDGEGRVIGMLSERELMRHLMSNYLQSGSGQYPSPTGATARRAVRDVMTRQVLCVSPEQPLAEVASIMTNKDVDRVPVVREGRLVGMLTRGDIVRKLIGS